MFTRVLLSNSDILAAHVFGGHRIDPVYRKSIWIGACRYSRRVCCEAPLPASEVLVCYGRAADMMSAPGQKRRFGDVRATSALPPKTDIHREGRHVSKGPIADILPAHSNTSSAVRRASRPAAKPSALAALRFTTSSNLVGCCIGNSAGVAPLSIRSR